MTANDNFESYFHYVMQNSVEDSRSVSALTFIRVELKHRILVFVLFVLIVV